MAHFHAFELLLSQLSTIAYCAFSFSFLLHLITDLLHHELIDLQKMARLRLQVQVLPWQERGSFPSEKAYDDATIIMGQPCLEDDTIEDLRDKIHERWAKTYVGYG